MFLKKNFYIIKIKRNIIPFIFILFTASLLIFSKTNLPAIKSGLILWSTSVIPALFPFFVATELLMHTNIINKLGTIFNKLMKPLFNICGEGSFAFIMGIISGYPVGAKIACNFRNANICSKEECERLLSFTNNSGPLFIIGTIGISMFKNSTIGILLFITHVLSCISVGIIFRFWKYSAKPSMHIPLTHSNTNYKYTTISNLGEVLAESISSSITTILVIGGFIVLFSGIISILKTSHILSIISLLFNPIFNVLHIDTAFVQPLISGLIEITNGINSISSIPYKKLSVNIIFTSFLLGCGGVSILLQVLSITSKTDLSIKPYIYGKLLQGIFASVYTYTLINIFPFLNFDL